MVGQRCDGVMHEVTSGQQQIFTGQSVTGLMLPVGQPRRDTKPDMVSRERKKRVV